MASSNFRINIIIRIVLLLAVLTACSWAIVHAEYLKLVYLSILLILLLLEFFIYVDRVNRDLDQFMSSIFHEDYTSVFKAGSKGRSFRRLYASMNDITTKFRSLSKEKETRGQYLFSLIEQVRVGIISYEPGGEVHLVNKAFREMLDAPSIRQGSDLQQLKPEIFTILNNASLGERQLVPLRIRNEEKEFSFLSTGFRMENRDFNLVSVQDIRKELDEREFEAWQKLIRVLTHEIMNSVTPIASLTGSLYDLLQEKGDEMGSDSLKGKISAGLGAIQERSEGLLRFTEAYQNLSRLPEPVIGKVKTAELVERIDTLFRSDLKKREIEFILDADRAPQEFEADVDLVEQVLINLIRNAREALTGVKQAEIRMELTQRTDHRIAISVRDNGPGIPKAILDRIFVPFFTTKKEGSGIGLSLSRQIVLMHKGVLNVSSQDGSGSVFEILL